AAEFSVDLQRLGLIVSPATGFRSFLHRSFLEFLAGVALAEDPTDLAAETIVTHAGEEPWREVASFAVNYLGLLRNCGGTLGRAEALIDAVLTLAAMKGQAAANGGEFDSRAEMERVGERSGRMGHALTLIARSLVEMWPDGVTDSCRASVLSQLYQLLLASPD